VLADAFGNAIGNSLADRRIRGRLAGLTKLRDSCQGDPMGSVSTGARSDRTPIALNAPVARMSMLPFSSRELANRIASTRAESTPPDHG
jgi:hypothetical protein